jgi:cellulose synthase/poly-beta-1,6-N-acetylglucosamine synthase-like glycosyltransferase
VLAVLERYRVPATFFVIGENVAAHAELLRRMIHDGDEIGVHTFTHPDLASLPAWQERLELDQTQLAIAGCSTCCGACLPCRARSARSAVRRSRKSGGVSDDTLAEDADLTMAICRAGWRVVYAPDARAWIEVPASVGQLWRQRYRWCYGTLQAMWKHKRAMVERGPAGWLGRRGLPYLFLLQVLLPLLAPLIDLAALYGLLAGNATTGPSAWLGLLAVQYAAALYTFRLDQQSMRPLWTLPLQQVLYRQLMYLVVIQSVASALYGVRLRWHKLRRTGEVTVPA